MTTCLRCEAAAKVADLVAREIDNTNNTASYIATAIRAGCIAAGHAEQDAMDEARLATAISQLAEEREAKAKLLFAVHDALHRECDGTADLPAEIRALRERLENAKQSTVEMGAEILGLRDTVSRLVMEHDQLRARMDSGGPTEA